MSAEGWGSGWVPSVARDDFARDTRTPGIRYEHGLGGGEVLKCGDLEARMNVPPPPAPRPYRESTPISDSLMPLPKVDRL